MSGFYLFANLNNKVVTASTAAYGDKIDKIVPVKPIIPDPKWVLKDINTSLEDDLDSPDDR